MASFDRRLERRGECSRQRRRKTRGPLAYCRGASGVGPVPERPSLHQTSRGYGGPSTWLRMEQRPQTQRREIERSFSTRMAVGVGQANNLFLSGRCGENRKNQRSRRFNLRYGGCVLPPLRRCDIRTSSIAIEKTRHQFHRLSACDRNRVFPLLSDELPNLSRTASVTASSFRCFACSWLSGSASNRLFWTN